MILYINDVEDKEFKYDLEFHDDKFVINIFKDNKKVHIFQFLYKYVDYMLEYLNNNKADEVTLYNSTEENNKVGIRLNTKQLKNLLSHRKDK